MISAALVNYVGAAEGAFIHAVNKHVRHTLIKVPHETPMVV